MYLPVANDLQCHNSKQIVSEKKIIKERLSAKLGGGGDLDCLIFRL